MRGSVPVTVLFADYLETKQRAKLSEKHLADIKQRLGRFVADFSDRAIKTLTVREIEDWLHELDLSPQTVNNFRAIIGAFFEWSEAYQDLLHYVPGRILNFHSRTAGGFRPGEKWIVRERNGQTVTLERNGKILHFNPSAKGKWDVLVSSMMQVSVGDQIRVTAGFREGKNAFKNNDVAQVREITNRELVLHDGRRMRRDGARIDQGVCITSQSSQCRTVDQVVALPDGADAKSWYVSLSRARDAMHVYTRNKTALRQSVMQLAERKSVWDLLHALPRSKVQSRDRMMPDLWATRQVQIVRATEMER